MHFPFTSMLNRNIWIKSIKEHINFLVFDFAINDIRYLYDDQALIRKNTVISKLVRDFMDTLYNKSKQTRSIVSNWVNSASIKI